MNTKDFLHPMLDAGERSGDLGRFHQVIFWVKHMKLIQNEVPHMIIGQIWSDSKMTYYAYNTFQLRFTVFILDIYTDFNGPTCEQVPLNTNKE